MSKMAISNYMPSMASFDNDCQKWQTIFPKTDVRDCQNWQVLTSVFPYNIEDRCQRLPEMAKIIELKFANFGI